MTNTATEATAASNTGTTVQLSEKDLSAKEFAQLQADLEAENQTSRSYLGWWFLLVLLLALLLAGQIVWYFYPEKIIQNSQLRPWLEIICRQLACQLPLTRDINQLHMQQNIVQIHPDLPNAVKVDAIFTNQAPFAQPYPQLRLTFSDLEGNPIASRTFEPQAYLNMPNLVDYIPPGGAVHVRLELVDMEAVISGDTVTANYRFVFF